MDINQWVPQRILTADKSGHSYAISVLNRNILIKPSTFIKLWNGAAVRVLVDGGANRWIKFVNNFGKGVTILPPDFLTGDLDSVTLETRSTMLTLGCKVISTQNQDETDFTKSLIAMYDYYVFHKVDFVLNLMEFSGRVDHILSQINTLFKANLLMKNIQVYLMTKNSLAWLLRPGNHLINVPDICVQEQYWCSYVPVGAATTVTTTGFRWDLTNQRVQFGGIVSTSNTYASTKLTLNCDDYLFWSMATELDTLNDND